MADETSKKDTAISLLIAHMLYEQEPTLDASPILAQVKRLLPNSEFLGTPSDALICFAHTDHVTTFADGQRIPGQTAIFSPEKSSSIPDLQPYLEQTRDWPGAASAAERCRYERTAVEFLSQALAPSIRLHLMQSVVRAIIEETRPVAIAWEAAQKLLEPAALLKGSGAADPSTSRRQALNVRLFRITNGQMGDTLMDTRGLAELGLPDIQMHFRDLPPGRIAGFLYNVAEYILANGDCIADGNTVEGIDRGQKWVCRHENSLWSPKRVVIDVNPGTQFASGTRRQ